MIKVLRSLKTEHVILLTFSKLISFIFFQNELKSIKHNNSFATRYRNAEIIKKKKFKNYLENVTMKEFLKFLDQFDEKFVKSLFCYHTKI